MCRWRSRVWKTFHLSSFQTGIDSYCRAILQMISYGAFCFSKPSPEQGAEEPGFSGTKVSEGNLQSLKNHLCHGLVVHCSFLEVFGKSGKSPWVPVTTSAGLQVCYKRAGQTSVFCYLHSGSLPSVLFLCLCFPSPTLLHTIITRWMWKFKILALEPAVCWLHWTMRGWRYFTKLERTKNTWLVL